MKGTSQEVEMTRTASVTVDEWWARESPDLREQTIHKIRAAMDVQVYGTDKVTKTQ